MQRSSCAAADQRRSAPQRRLSEAGLNCRAELKRPGHCWNAHDFVKRNAGTRSAGIQLTAVLSPSHPQSLWALAAICKSTVPQRKAAASTVLSNAKRLSADDSVGPLLLLLLLILLAVRITIPAVLPPHVAKVGTRPAGAPTRAWFTLVIGPAHAVAAHACAIQPCAAVSMATAQATRPDRLVRTLILLPFLIQGRAMFKDFTMLCDQLVKLCHHQPKDTKSKCAPSHLLNCFDCTAHLLWFYVRENMALCVQRLKARYTVVYATTASMQWCFDVYSATQYVTSFRNTQRLLN